MTDELVMSALEKAIRSRSVMSGTIVHTDQGSQYVSHNFRALLRAIGCRQSMSRRGNCYDNAQAESFFSRYKAELLEGGIFEDVSQARSESFAYIEGYYVRPFTARKIAPKGVMFGQRHQDYAACVNHRQ